ncbi:MAG: tetratricopeptide repeat protein [Acidobacteria bacterium]|nr:tetratricopeptide repeat protein [Acidobacteriota bacterium]
MRRSRPGRVLAGLASALIAAAAQTHGPEWQSLDKAYAALREKAYDAAVAHFQAAVSAAPQRADIRKDLAYTYLKIGEPEAARDQFAQAMRLDPAGQHVALEYAFLCYETRMQAEARRVFDRIRKLGNPTAEQAFQNIDRPLAEGIARWQRAIELAPDNWSNHEELAKLAEQRDQLELAARNYEIALHLRPDLRYLLLDLGRVWKMQGRTEQAHAALLAASRGTEPRVAETARELLPSRYPYVYEFRRAIGIDPKNTELRRELAYLFLEMDQIPGAEIEFTEVLRNEPNDLLSAAQLGFLRLKRNDAAGARPLLEPVLRSGNEELADRVRFALGLPRTLRKRPETPRSKVSVEAKLLAEKSLQAGYLKDALKYLRIAHENDPLDFSIILKLGWTSNILHDDKEAIRWFRLARKSPDHAIAREASHAYRSLRPALARFRTSLWAFPFFSTRWHTAFSYAQLKTEMRLGELPFRPYVSLRLMGDSRGRTLIPNLAGPQYLSDTAVIAGLGIGTKNWRGLSGWMEAGTAMSYLSRARSSRLTPDYRGGLAFGRGFGHNLGPSSRGWFYETTADAIFISRFDNDFLVYSQHRTGYTLPAAGAVQWQLYWNGNLTADAKRLYWANFHETGPGLRLQWQSAYGPVRLSVDALRGEYLMRRNNPYGGPFYDIRAGLWYAFTY